MLPQVRDIRRLGSCALDLCAVACGPGDGYVEEGPHAWDHAAGGLVATEAGAHRRGWTPVGGRDLVVCAPAVDGFAGSSGWDSSGTTAAERLGARLANPRRAGTSGGAACVEESSAEADNTERVGVHNRREWCTIGAVTRWTGDSL